VARMRRYVRRAARRRRRRARLRLFHRCARSPCRGKSSPRCASGPASSTGSERSAWASSRAASNTWTSLHSR
jgi:hypothetical protein